MKNLFFYGTLGHVPLLNAVLGRDVPDSDWSLARLKGHAAHWVKDQPFPVLIEQAGAVTDGKVIRGLTETDIARLDFYEGAYGYNLVDIKVETEQGTEPAQVYLPEADRWTPGAPWSLADWAASWGDVTVDAARDEMRRFGTADPQDVKVLAPFLQARAWARRLAQDPAPTTLRANMGRADVEITRDRGGFDGFFSLRAFTLRHRKYDGTWSEAFDREAFLAFDAALVLPYDPKTDQVLLIEQLRYGPVQRTDPLPWVLEPIAGLVDAGEDPAETARREAVEEARLALSEIRPMTRVYPSPGYSSEFFHCFLGLCDLSGYQAGVGGHEMENEDIRSHVMSLNKALDLVDSGEINVAPLAMMLLWLFRRRDALRSEA